MQVFGDDGARIDVRVDGFAGNAVVMIHGFPVTRDIWDAQAKAFARTHRVVLPDLRGMGASSVPDGPYLMETLASDIAAALDALAIERAAFVGHSLGGYVALAFARMYTERVTHLALVCSRIAADTQETAENRRKTADSIERDGALPSEMTSRLFAPETVSERPEIAARVLELARSIDPRGAAAMQRGMAMRVASDDIAPDLDFPMLMVAGAQDALVPIEEARAVARAFPKGRLIVCERSGHLPMIEEPDRVTEALVALLT
ncbi:MAG TPA: alpha/beta hydrolase [Candidatus Baltobacteraceae bacterium]|jgi:pimeloyl-ACP methyl ester carboxylesterase|nr:alpha/beta hydrolase [Candidatus Baltobacteraceae bacterium]